MSDEQMNPPEEHDSYEDGVTGDGSKGDEGAGNDRASANPSEGEHSSGSVPEDGLLGNAPGDAMDAGDHAGEGPAVVPAAEPVAEALPVHEPVPASESPAVHESVSAPEPLPVPESARAGVPEPVPVRSRVVAPVAPGVPVAPREADIEREIRNRSRRAFLVGGVAMLAGYGGWRWLRDSAQDLGIPGPLRAMLGLNESVARTYFSNAHLATTYPAGLAMMPRTNGDIGLGGTFDAAAWRLQLVGLSSQKPGAPPVMVTLDEIMALPHVEHITELRCIEGWTQVVHWGGARLADLLKRYPPATLLGDAPDVEGHPEKLVPYVSIETPDRGYYVGLEMASALHPQTLLCYEMGGKPLLPEHGAPLRLVVPVKYGIKNIKRIGTIRFMSARPADYWGERGYDWYAGL